ncbi:cell agglutination protein Mam3 [Sedimentibacter hydroxybenzoicus DSM 7310]|uniref:Cell agglutination protein Mam3 n=1 Tax=Sedimentibacter hydroxybenzoicus DSM 7310 TaxID=1123245 RepID=A0A974BMG3_SEDHY|nr:cell agglutination protein Mam3 [Sedimentibacter hydroxybenzoicus]NYB75526.1 cell agglutination protein Mam3 [Sedimentibacter hydroxybenzoicus DSM 7310]
MKLKKIGAAVLATAVMLGSIGIGDVYAIEQQKNISVYTNNHIITPFWSEIINILPSISASGNAINPKVYIEAKSPSASIIGTMYLEKYSSGRWVNVTSWSLKGTGSLSSSKSYSGTLNTKYRTRVVVTINGETAEAVSAPCET